MTGDGARAWSYLRCSRQYREAWAKKAAPPVREDGTPFPVRIRSQADRAAEDDWGLLAWEDPDGAAVSAFFAGVPMLEGSGSAWAPPLLGLLPDAGVSVEGLRLARPVTWRPSGVRDIAIMTQGQGRAIPAAPASPSPLRRFRPCSRPAPGPACRS